MYCLVTLDKHFSSFIGFCCVGSSDGTDATPFRIASPFEIVSMMHGIVISLHLFAVTLVHVDGGSLLMFACCVVVIFHSFLSV